MPEIPIDVYQLVNLTSGHSYQLSISKVDGYSGFTVFDRLSGKAAWPLNVTTFSETITPTGASYGPIEVSLTGGLTSLFPGNLGYASTSYQISLLDANTPSVPIQPAEGLHDGMLIKSADPNDRTVYLVENGTKRAFPSASHFNSWYFGRWDRIVPVAAYTVVNTPTADSMPFKDGTLVKYSDRPSDATVFLIHRGVRRAFTSWASFIFFRHSASDIMLVPASVLDSVGRGVDLTAPGGSGIGGQTAGLQLTFSPNPSYVTNISNCSSGTGVFLHVPTIGDAGHRPHAQRAKHRWTHRLDTWRFF